MEISDLTAKRTSDVLFDEAECYAPGGVNSAARALSPKTVWRKAHGSKLQDIDGAQYIDYHAAFGPIILGHNDATVNQRAVEALQSIDLMGNGTTEAEIRLAKKLCEHIPSAERALLCVTGSEATHHCIRLARAVTGRKKLIKFQGCFHGSSDYLCMNVITPREKIGQYDPGFRRHSRRGHASHNCSQLQSDRRGGGDASPREGSGSSHHPGADTPQYRGACCRRSNSSEVSESLPSVMA